MGFLTKPSGLAMESLCLPADRKSLQQFRTFVLTRLEQWHVPDSLVSKIDLILEELLINIIDYSYLETRGDIELQCSLQKKRFCLIIQDRGIPFDPLAQEPPDLSNDIEARKVGGLGVFLVRQLVDELSYQRKGDANILTLCINTVTKNIPPKKDRETLS